MQLAQQGIISTNLAQQQTISLSGRTVLRAYGDSFTAGQNASNSANRFINQYTTNKSLTLTNLASGGRGVWYAADQSANDTYTRSATVLSVMAGLNDIRRNGDATKTLNKIEAAHRAIVLKAISSTTTAGGSAGCTRVGTFSPYNARAVGGTYNSTNPIPNATTAAVASGDGDYWEWTFTGTQFGIQFICNSGDVQTFGVATIAVDGVTVATLDTNDKYDNVSDGTYDNRRGPYGFTWHGLTNASHTVRVTRSVGFIVVDYFCLIQTPANSAALLFAEIPYLNTTGYALSPALGTASISNVATARIQAIINEYRALGFIAALVNTNRYYNLNNGIDTDNIHPNDTGHDQIDLAYRAASE